MRAAAVLVAALALLVVAAGCSDKEKKTGPRELSAVAFEDRVAAAVITGTDLEAEAGFGQAVSVSARDSLNKLTLPLEKPYAEYKAHHDRLDSIVGELVDEAETRMETANSAERFAAVRSHLLPVLKPLAAFRRVTDDVVEMPFPGALRVAYAVQRTDSFMTVTRADLARWKVSVADLHRVALANILRETNRDQPLRCEEKLCGWASGDGYDAARLIVPELREQIVRKIGRAVFAVPRESVYVALPIKLADRIREKVTRDFVTAPNPVSPDLFVERGGELVVLPS